MKPPSTLKWAMVDELDSVGTSAPLALLVGSRGRPPPREPCGYDPARTQPQAGGRSIESTRIYLHLANDWLAGEYRKAAEAIDAQLLADGQRA